MRKIQYSLKSLVVGGAAFFLALALSFGWGYFFGRLEQIAFNKSVLEVIPDVQCIRSGSPES